MFDTIYLILILLFFKHWIIDFLFQTDEQVAQKGIYGKWKGIEHSLQHGLGTVFVLAWFLPFIETAIILGIVDFVCHYHIDWLKMKINKWRSLNITMPEFWFWLGADQFAHQLTYIFIVWCIL